MRVLDLEVTIASDRDDGREPVRDGSRRSWPPGGRVCGRTSEKGARDDEGVPARIGNIHGPDSVHRPSGPRTWFGRKRAL